MKHFKDMGEAYKAEIIGSIPADQDVSLYREGAFEDLCRGPHVPSTGKLKFFKLMKLAGAYWRGDHRNEMLQRIYGTAWATKEELAAVPARCWRKPRSATTASWAASSTCSTPTRHAPGMVFWHPKGWAIWQGDRAVHAQGIYQEQRLPGGQGSAGDRQERSGS